MRVPSKTGALTSFDERLHFASAPFGSGFARCDFLFIHPSFFFGLASVLSSILLSSTSLDLNNRTDTDKPSIRPVGEEATPFCCGLEDTHGSPSRRHQHRRGTPASPKAKSLASARSTDKPPFDFFRLCSARHDVCCSSSTSSANHPAVVRHTPDCHHQAAGHQHF